MVGDDARPPSEFLDNILDVHPAGNYQPVTLIAFKSLLKSRFTAQLHPIPWAGSRRGHIILRLVRCFGAFFNKLLSEDPRVAGIRGSWKLRGLGTRFCRPNR
jgi:hypothetical protein